jgi:hypothetical protein
MLRPCIGRTLPLRDWACWRHKNDSFLDAHFKRDLVNIVYISNIINFLALSGQDSSES